MSKENNDLGLLFGNIPLKKLDRTARWRDGGISPTCSFLREPLNLQEINQYNYHFAIQHQNGATTYVTPEGSGDVPDTFSDFLTLRFGDEGPTLHILGPTDVAITETLEYFSNLEDVRKRNCFLQFSSTHIPFQDSYYSCRVQAHCLERLFRAAPSREYRFHEITLTAEQLSVLATRPHPVRITFSEMRFEDEGTAFVDSLESRMSTFGSLTLEGLVLFSKNNVKRLLKVGTIEHLRLTCCSSSPNSDLPFSANVKSLGYEISSNEWLKHCEWNIVAHQFSLTIKYSSGAFPTEHFILFFRRLAELGHFTELNIQFEGTYCRFDSPVGVPDSVLETIIDAAVANFNLKTLALGGSLGDLTEPQLAKLFQRLKDHSGLRTVKISTSHKEVEPAFASLAELLSHNRNISVRDEYGRIYSDKSSIDRLYALNGFYRGSASFVTDPPPERLSLVMTALLIGALNSFQRSALLLANHTDVLHQLVQYARMDNEVDDDDLLAMNQDQKRQRTN